MNEENQIYDETFKVSIDNFEGPLDLLLSLIKDAKMDIKTIKLAKVTEPYLEYIKQMDCVDMEKASSFILIAATLIEIKSKALIPQEQDDLEEDDEETKLKQQLEAYQLFKKASEDLASIENINHLYREPDKMADKSRIIIKDMVLDKLLDAFVGILQKIETKELDSREPRKIVKDRFTVAEKIVQIRQTIQTKKQMKFTELFEADSTKSEVINVFLALLELLKMQVVKAHQPDNFAEILIVSNVGEDDE